MVIGFGNNSPLLQGRKWLKSAIMGIIMLASVTSEHEMGTPSAESLCVSDCSTCPLICSPPPPPPPSSVLLAPLEPYYTPRSPSESDDTHCPPPLESESLPSPARPPPTPRPPAPSSYSSKASPPPPRFVYFTDAPPGGVGPQEYPYPYYYYPSKASPLSFKASSFLVMLFCLNAVSLHC